MRHTRKPPVKLSIIIPTRNSTKTLAACLQSLYHPAAERIVVDNFSDDATAEIAHAYAEKVIKKGPERHAQRRAGAAAARGRWLLFFDSDMTASASLVAEVIDWAESGLCHGLIIKEVPHGADTFWTRVKCAERASYAGCDATEAARAFDRGAYDAVGGFSPDMISAEDWDLTRRFRAGGYTIKRTIAPLHHDEGRVTLAALWRKKAYYAGAAGAYVSANGAGSLLSKIPLFRRSFWRAVGQNLDRPRIAFGMIFLVSWTTLAAAYGFIFKR